MKSCEYKSGVTLVEILVVVGIIAILASMVVGLAGRIDDQSKERALKNTFALVESALQEYHEVTGDFPPEDGDPGADARSRSGLLYSKLNSVASSRQILEKIIRPPSAPDELVIYDPWKGVLDYRYNPKRHTFPWLISAGPDNKFGTSDDIKNWQT